MENGGSFFEFGLAVKNAEIEGRICGIIEMRD